MTTIRERCLAILKEPGAYGAIPPYAAERNAQHRLKLICEEIAAQVRGAYHAEEFGDGSTIIIQDCPDKIAAAILAIGADQ